MAEQYKRLRLILGDQLNASHSWYKEQCKDTVYLIAELRQEQHYVKHHIQKTQAFFCAMQHFANALSKAGHTVSHLTLTDTENETLPELLNRLVEEMNVSHFDYQHPDEYRLSHQLKSFCGSLEKKQINTSCVSSEHFYLEHSDLANYFKEKTAHRMEAFYRKLRQKFNILIDDDGQPTGGQWNYDQANRNKMKESDIRAIPKPLLFENDVSAINQRLNKYNIETIGEGKDINHWPVTRAQAKELLKYFLKHDLRSFGTFQDAMVDKNGSEFSWSLHHSRISFALNCKMISPHFVVSQAIAEYQNNEDISIEQIEGFVRQILGWREFVRGIYWLNMPGYKSLNSLNAERSLPNFYWHANTKMNCMNNAISQSLDFAYAHHIQRLMITGNFALLIGANPDEVDEWYLGIYIDAIEWVELPNTRGMSQFADGGLLASKAYAASGNYIDKMSNYCKKCQYNVKKRTEDDACPFNALYWAFMEKHREKFEENPRQSMVYRNWDKKTEEEKRELLARADWLLANLDNI